MVDHAHKNEQTQTQMHNRKSTIHLEAVQVLHSAANARKNAAELGAATNRREVRSYKCPRCHGFHITSQSALAA